MYKVKTEKEITKSHYLKDICEFVIANPREEHQFYIGYSPINHDKFLKLLLQNKYDFNTFLSIYKEIKKPITLIEYVRTEKEQKHLQKNNQS